MYRRDTNGVIEFLKDHKDYVVTGVVVATSVYVGYKFGKAFGIGKGFVMGGMAVEECIKALEPEAYARACVKVNSGVKTLKEINCVLK